MQLRQAKNNEESLVSDLAVKVFKPNMKEQFLRLYHPNNIEHMFVAVDENKVVSSVNYYNTLIQTNMGSFHVSSIGSVCTDESYRKRGISSQLLIDAEKLMIKESIDFCIISGRRGMYQRFGAREVGAIKKFIITPNTKSDDFQVKEFNQEFKEIYDIYQKETIKYERSFDEFIDLWKGQTYPDSYQTYHTYLIFEKGEVTGYVIVINHHDKDVLQVKEFAGKRYSIKASLKTILDKHHKKSVEIFVSYQDEIIQFIEEEGQMISQQATIKIIHAESFLNKINHILEKKSSKMKFIFEDHTYMVHLNEQTISFNHDEIHQLIFSGLITKELNHHFIRELQTYFPIELPWSHNLNYQ